MVEESQVYRDLPVLTAEEVARALASGKHEEISLALLSSSHHSAHPGATAVLCREFLDSPDPELRRVATLSLGHIARLHSADYDFTTDFEAVLGKLNDQNTAVRGTADDVLSDMQTSRFTNRVYSRGDMEDSLAFGSLLDKFSAAFTIAREDPDPLYVFKMSLQCLQHSQFPIRVAGMWAILDRWDELSTPLKIEARERVSSLLNDSNDWVRENAGRALVYMADDD